MTPQPRARKYDPDAEVITRSDTVASPLRVAEDAPSSGFGLRAPRELQPYTSRSPELLPTSDDPTVVDGLVARSSLPPPRPLESRVPASAPRASEQRMSLTPPRGPEPRRSLTPPRVPEQRVSLTPSRALDPRVSLAPPRVPSQPLAAPGAAPEPQARGADYGPWLLVLGTTLGAALIGAVLGYVTRPSVVEGAADTERAPVVARPAPRATATPPAPRDAANGAPRSSDVREPSPRAASTVPVMRLGELPVAEPPAPEPSAAPVPPPARHAPAPRPASTSHSGGRHR
jgi:hypothetical protein